MPKWLSEALAQVLNPTSEGPRSSTFFAFRSEAVNLFAMFPPCGTSLSLRRAW